MTVRQLLTTGPAQTPGAVARLRRWTLSPPFVAALLRMVTLDRPRLYLTPALVL
ncbi:MAG: hypothetical protein GX062_03430 [Firmicutes bacterium]|nr:hypothetical protein [Bacillota bacterium]